MAADDHHMGCCIAKFLLLVILQYKASWTEPVQAMRCKVANDQGGGVTDRSSTPTDEACERPKTD